MSYEIGEALIATQIVALSSFTANTVAQGKWGSLRTGRASVYAILRPGPFEVIWNGDRKRVTQYNTFCEIWQRYTDDGTTKTNLITRADEIRTRIDQYRKLADTGATIRDAVVRSGDEPQLMFSRNRNGRTDGPFWLRQTLTIEWQEETLVAFAE
jgi:hypothetical protein